MIFANSSWRRHIGIVLYARWESTEKAWRLTSGPSRFRKLGAACVAFRFPGAPVSSASAISIIPIARQSSINRILGFCATCCSCLANLGVNWMFLGTCSAIGAVCATHPARISESVPPHHSCASPCSWYFRALSAISLLLSYIRSFRRSCDVAKLRMRSFNTWPQGSPLLLAYQVLNLGRRLRWGSPATWLPSGSIVS